MPDRNLQPNDSADTVERINKTITNMEAAKEAMQFADGEELERIKEKNDRRKEQIQDMKRDVKEEDRFDINGY